MARANGSGVLQGDQDPQCNPDIGHPCHTSNAWAQFDGNSVYSCLSAAIGANYLAPSESESVGPETTASKVQTQMLETAGSGTGVCTSQAWTEAMTYAMTLSLEDTKGLVKMVLLARGTGDLGDHGIGVHLKIKTVSIKQRFP